VTTSAKSSCDPACAASAKISSTGRKLVFARITKTPGELRPVCTWSAKCLAMVCLSCVTKIRSFCCAHSRMARSSAPKGKSDESPTRTASMCKPPSKLWRWMACHRGPRRCSSNKNSNMVTTRRHVDGFPGAGVTPPRQYAVNSQLVAGLARHGRLLRSCPLPHGSRGSTR
jgi:hypothetical protein